MGGGGSTDRPADGGDAGDDRASRSDKRTI